LLLGARPPSMSATAPSSALAGAGERTRGVRLGVLLADMATSSAQTVALKVAVAEGEAEQLPLAEADDEGLPVVEVVALGVLERVPGGEDDGDGEAVALVVPEAPAVGEALGEVVALGVAEPVAVAAAPGGEGEPLALALREARCE
jgi:hypothetical protein